MSRAYTKQESIDALAYKFKNLVGYWKAEKRQPELREKVSGVCFSMLTTLDGCSADLPQFKIVDQAGADLTEMGLHDHYQHPYKNESPITKVTRVIGQQAASCEAAVIMFLEALQSEKLIMSMESHPDDKSYCISNGENWWDSSITFTPEEILTAFKAFQE
jgi:hypothetical protein